jgi:hypothetical protein
MVFFTIGLFGLISALHKQKKDNRLILQNQKINFEGITEDFVVTKP